MTQTDTEVFDRLESGMPTQFVFSFGEGHADTP
jgi:hypothetical protein